MKTTTDTTTGKGRQVRRPGRFLSLAVTAGVIAACGITSAFAFKKVIIDPGHGGHDRGAYRGYIFEKHLALDVAFRVERYLQKRGVNTTLTRRRDTFIPLGDRSGVANRTGDCIFVSIHFNAARNTGAAGLETFYNSGRSRLLAAHIQGETLRTTGSNNRGVKHANFAVLRRNSRPAALVECGFLTNSSERRRCLDPAYRQRVAEGIAEGILKYRRSS